MAINLQKGQKVSLSKESPGLSKVIVGLGWDEGSRSRKDCCHFLQESRISTVMHLRSF